MAAKAWNLPSDAAIAAILAERIDKQRDGVGIVVGVIDRSGHRIVSHGVAKRRGRRPVGGGTVFEIGSITKVFTSLALADMVEKGEVRLDDPVAGLLPAGVTMPERGGRQITLEDLATHHSGLPRMPTNFDPADPGNPFADYTVEQLYAFLAAHALGRDIGESPEYSNVGVGLLGHVLARRAGVDYETLIRQRVTGPLGMDDTSIALSASQKRRLAHGHNSKRTPVPNWDLPTLAGAGALRSTVNDLLTFLAAELGFTRTPLDQAMWAQRKLRRPFGMPDMSISLGWVVRSTARDEVVWHNGGTGGYRTFAGLNLARGFGAVVLTNVSNVRGGDDIGLHLLTGSELASRQFERAGIAIEPAILQKYVGRYRITPDVCLTIRWLGDGLTGGVTAQGEAPIFAETPTKFFWNVVDAQITFELDADGRAASAVLHQAGRDMPAVRLAEESA
jgi:D-alanyl-D-alanine-carboxypeptidase/D-alanyl-D-alanine-endopeptidase